MDQNNFLVLDSQEQLEELGLLALEVTLLRYMIGLGEESRVGVQAWLDSNVLEENFITKLLSEYPDIAGILAEEINLAKESSMSEI